MELDSDACKLAGESEQMNSVSNHNGVAEILKILAAIPCYNESLAIGTVALKASRYVDEVLVVDDGSIDDTVEVAEVTGATVVAHEENKGKGRAVKNALRYAVESEMTGIANDQDLRFADLEINCKYGDFKTSTKNRCRMVLVCSIQ